MAESECAGNHSGFPECELSCFLSPLLLVSDVSEATALTGHHRRLGYKSRSQLYRLINDGYLHDHVHVQQHTGQRLVDIEGLREKLQRICQWRPHSVFSEEACCCDGQGESDSKKQCKVHKHQYLLNCVISC